MGSNDACSLTGLSLGLRFSSRKLDQNQPKEYNKLEKEKTLLLKYDHVLPSLSLGSALLQCQSRRLGEELTGGQTSSMSPGSSNSNSSTVKKERVGFGGEDRASDEDDQEASCPRKKLRLTKEQSVVLEDSFKQHSTLNPNEKQALARQLNLRPRQVEVWFQNRRARTKLKQTEMDCELLKKCCDSLTEENKRLRRELQELRALKLNSTATATATSTATSTTTVFMQMPAATLSICPACEKINAATVKANPIAGPPNTGRSICSPFARSSAAC
ncbi:hypothetical protein Cgig2_008246 [Carnegiea gigantea]|uniref:Homeobox domain-containing protein n=1 Tax=Carnegiea gigantea TaxID=171969 RepID=A0A9Q1L3E7_9CARY|nr:hypothetical protein Cgig2_008246 [Carnegiea gigantea]